MTVRSVLSSMGARYMGSRLPRIVSLVAVMSWPFLFHFQLAFRVHGGFRALDNDFGLLYYPYKPYLLANLAHGHIPLWMPQEAAGFSFVLDPFTQALYPGNLVILPIAWLQNHWGPLDEQRYTIFAVSIVSLGLFLILRKLGLGRLASALAALIVSSSYKVTETMRFPNATHSVAWVTMALFAIIALRVESSTLKKLAFSGLLFGSIVCLTTAGYPYYVVYFFLTLIPFLLWLEFGTPHTFQRAKSGFAGFIVAVTCSIGGALLLVSPYLLGMRRLLNETTDRSGTDWSYSTAYHFDGWSYVGSVLLPPLASPEGWFYFGTAGLAVVVLATLIVHARGGLSRHRLKVGLLALWIGSVVFVGLSGSNPLFRFFWETVPFVDTLRVWGRANIILIFPLAVVLGFSLQVLVDEYHDRALMIQNARKYLLFAATTLVCVLILQLVLSVTRPADSEFKSFMESYYGAPGVKEYLVATALALAVVTAGLLALNVFRKNLRWPQMAMVSTFWLFAAVWVLQIHGLRRGPWMWVDRGVATVNSNSADIPIRDYAVVSDLATGALTNPRLGPTGTSPVFEPRPPWTTAVFPNWDFRRYVRFLDDSSVREPWKANLLGTTSRTRFFLAEGGGAREQRPKLIRKVHVDVISYNGSHLVADVRTRRAGELVFADNWDHGWKATVNGQPSPVIRAFGTFKSVVLPRGRSRVEMSYCPFDDPVYRWLC